MIQPSPSVGAAETQVQWPTIRDALIVHYKTWTAAETLSEQSTSKRLFVSSDPLNAVQNPGSKCDQAKPKCSRCLRRQEPCIGAGVQRYAFQNVTKDSYNNSRLGTSHELPVRTREILPKPRCIEDSLLSRELTHILDVSDPRYDVCWSYGDVLKEIPRRLGSNVTLDASVVALLATYASFATNQRCSAPTAEYGLAIRSLRKALEIPSDVDPYTLVCAIYLLWICQTWMGSNGLGHTSGIVQILWAVPRPVDEFGRLLLMTIGVTAAFERLFDPTMSRCQWIEQFILEVEAASRSVRHDPARPMRRGLMACVLRLPSLMEYDPSLHDEIRDAYQHLQDQSAVLRERLLVLTRGQQDRLAPEGPLNCNSRHLTHCQRTQAIHLSLQAIMNGILQVYAPDDTALEQDMVDLTQSVLDLVIAGSTWKPLGAAWIPFCLISVWGASTDDKRRNEIAGTWETVWGSHADHSVKQAAERLAENFRRLRLEAALEPNLVATSPGSIA